MSDVRGSPIARAGFKLRAGRSSFVRDTRVPDFGLSPLFTLSNPRTLIAYPQTAIKFNCRQFFVFLHN